MPSLHKKFKKFVADYDRSAQQPKRQLIEAFVSRSSAPLANRAEYCVEELRVDVRLLCSPKTAEIRVALAGEAQTHTIQLSRSAKSFRKIAGKNGAYRQVRLFAAAGVHVFVCGDEAVATERLIEKGGRQSLCHILAPKAAASAKVVVAWARARGACPRLVIDAISRDRSRARLLGDESAAVQKETESYIITDFNGEQSCLKVDESGEFPIENKAGVARKII